MYHQNILLLKKMNQVIISYNCQNN